MPGANCNMSKCRSSPPIHLSGWCSLIQTACCNFAVETFDHKKYTPPSTFLCVYPYPANQPISNPATPNLAHVCLIQQCNHLVMPQILSIFVAKYQSHVRKENQQYSIHGRGQQPPHPCEAKHPARCSVHLTMVSEPSQPDRRAACRH